MNRKHRVVEYLSFACLVIVVIIAVKKFDINKAGNGDYPQGLVAVGANPVAKTKVGSAKKDLKDLPIVLVASLQKKEVPADPFADLNLKARAVYVYDIRNEKEVFGMNENETLPLASLTKVMTTVTAAGMSSSDSVISVNKDVVASGDATDLVPNEKWNVFKLLQYTLVASSNDGAAAVAAALGSGLANTDQSASTSQKMFVAEMNQKAQDLGLLSMRFLNPSGLDVSPTLAGGYGSAKDVETLMSYAITNYKDIFAPTSQDSFTVSSEDNISHSAKNTDIITGDIPGLIAGKTGYTDLAGGNLAVDFDIAPNRPIMIVVLGSTYDDRFMDVKKLVQATIKKL